MIEPGEIEQRSLFPWIFLRQFTILFLWILLGIATFGHIMMRPIEPNEHMYVAAAVLTMEHEIYADFPFLQMPNLPYVYAAIYRLTGTEYYLFVARVVTWVATMMSCSMMGAIAWQFARSQHGFQAIFAAWILALSESFILVTGECSNYVFPILFSLVAFWALVALPSRFGSGLAGFAVAMAVGFKLYYASLVPLFAIAVLLLPVDWDKKCWNLAAFFAFGLFGALPSVLSLVRNTETFLYDNIEFHLQTARWFHEIHYHDRLLLFDKVRYAKSCLQHPSQMWIAFGIAFTLVDFIWRTPDKDPLGVEHSRRNRRWGLLSASLVAMSLLTALVPTPMWPQYVGMVVPFALVLVLAVGNQFPFEMKRALLVCFLVGLVVSGPYYLRSMPHLFQTKSWVPIAYHNESREIFRSFQLNNDAVIATFMPLMVVEAGYRILPEFANARFLYQVSHKLSDKRVAKIRTTSPSHLDTLLDSKQPELIVTPFLRFSQGNALCPEDDLDRYAKEHGYFANEFSLSQLHVWRIAKNPR